MIYYYDGGTEIASTENKVPKKISEPMSDEENGMAYIS
jgi:hypothetical protein